MPLWYIPVCKLNSFQLPCVQGQFWRGGDHSILVLLWNHPWTTSRTDQTWSPMVDSIQADHVSIFQANNCYSLIQNNLQTKLLLLYGELCCRQLCMWVEKRAAERLMVRSTVSHCQSIIIYSRVMPLCIDRCRLLHK